MLTFRRQVRFPLRRNGLLDLRDRAAIEASVAAWLTLRERWPTGIRRALLDPDGELELVLDTEPLRGRNTRLAMGCLIATLAFDGDGVGGVAR